jgi:gamma-glutamylcyclotransferase (GGCT)/AIG2-like uncharacterized protein YtfP
MTERLFVYGSLIDPEVRRAVLKRDVEVIPDSVRGYRLARIWYGNDTYPVVIEDRDCEEIIEGGVISVTEDDLVALDRYEGPYYRREKVRLRSGQETWVYVKA